jgi:hypothetical protein
MSVTYENNLYYHPEVHGLEKIAEHDFSSGSYEFDYRVVWADKKGRLFTARDSGCSCPSPFEDYDQGIESLERLTSFTVLADEYKEAVKEGYRNLQGWDSFRDDVRAALRKLRGR